MTFPYLYCYDILPAKQLHLTWYWHKLGRLKYFTILGQRLRQYPVRCTKPMRTLLASILLMFIVSTQSCSTTKKYGRYAGSGYSIILKDDNTFTYRYQGHLSGDTTAGTYAIDKDTLIMSYHLNNYDSIIHAAEARKETPPIEIMLSSRGWILRPHKIIWKNKKLFIIDKETNEVNRNFSLKFYKWQGFVQHGVSKTAAWQHNLNNISLLKDSSKVRLKEHGIPLLQKHLLRWWQ